MTVDVVRVGRVQAATLLMHFQPGWAARILDGDELGLSAAEKALFAGVDRRAFGADAERPARAVAVIVEELPVAVAVKGVAHLFSFFSSAAFVDVVLSQQPLVPTAAAWLGVVPAQIEGAIACARRRRTPLAAGLQTAPGVAVSQPLPAGSLERYSAARARLGPDAVAAVGAGSRVPWPDPDDAADDDAADDAILVTGGLIDPALSTCAPALAELLAVAMVPGPREHLLDCARRHGCDDAEAQALLTELLSEGLLVDVM